MNRTGWPSAASVSRFSTARPIDEVGRRSPPREARQSRRGARRTAGRTPRSAAPLPGHPRPDLAVSPPPHPPQRSRDRPNVGCRGGSRGLRDLLRVGWATVLPRDHGRRSGAALVTSSLRSERSAPACLAARSTSRRARGGPLRLGRCQQTSVDRNRGAVDVLRRRAGQVADEIGDLVRLAKTVHRDPLLLLPARVRQIRAVPDLMAHRGHDDRRADRVYLDARKFTQGIDNAEIIATVHAPKAPMIPASTGPESEPSHADAAVCSTGTGHVDEQLSQPPLVLVVPGRRLAGVGADDRIQAKDGMTRDLLSSSATMRAGVVRSTEPEEVPCDDRNGIRPASRADRLGCA